MFLAFVLLLISVTVTSQQAEQENLRNPRQLDLGLQDINYSNDKGLNISAPLLLTDSKEKHFLPSSDVIGTQSDQNADLKSVNAFENESELCKPPFGAILCRSKAKTSNASSKNLIQNIQKPSQDLVPPYDEFERDAVLNSLSTVRPKIQEATRPAASSTDKFLASSVPNYGTLGTSKPAAKIVSAHESTRKTELPNNQNTKPKTASETQATNELRSYLPPQPEYSAAAQTSINVVKPAEENDHDHHHHHHHHNGNICEDAFHSFLCAPLKARKRITGALPNSLRGQSSFIQYRKVLPNPDKDPAPSNTFENEYLPPRTAEPPRAVSASSKFQSTYSTPRTTQRKIVTPTTSTTTTTRVRPFVPEPSNLNGSFYLPPSADNSIFISPLINPDSTNQVNNALKLSSTTQILPTFSTPVIPLQFGFAHVSPLVTEKPLVVAPISTTQISTEKIVPSESFQKAYSKPITRTPVLPIISTFAPLPSNEDRFYLPPNPSPQPAASFISTTKNVFPTGSTFSPQPSTSFVTTTKSPLRKSSFVPLPSNIDNSFLHLQPKFQPTVNFISTTVKPFTTTTKKSYSSTSEIINQASAINDKSYLPPDPNVQPEAAQINAAIAVPQVKNPFHHGRDLCTDPFHSFLCTVPRPRKRITGAVPSGFRPDSTNTNELRVKPAPSYQSESSIKPDKPLDSSPTQSVGYKYPKPAEPFPSTTLTPSTGYSYPKPDKIFPSPSQPQEIKYTSPPVVTKKVSVPVFQTSEARQVSTGYQYPKPEQKFPLPSQQERDRISTTLKPTTGYSYPKPQKPFPLPTEQKEIRYSSPKPTASSRAPSPSSLAPSVAQATNQNKGYQYPKPQQSFDLPEKKGYSYPKPEKRLELPTEDQSKLSLPQTKFNGNVLGDLGSAEFIPVNKVDLARDESKNLLARFGERLKKREKRPSK